MADIEFTSAALYNGGWRSDDRDELIEEYHLSEDEADAICKKLQEYESI